MKNIRKITAVLIAAMLLLGVFPAAVGETYSDFANTHWYAKSFCAMGIDYSVLCPLVFGVPDPFTSSLMGLVSDPGDLTRMSLCSLCVTLDLDADGTYTTFIGISFLGNLKDSATGMGTWTVRNNELILDAESENSFSIPCRNGTLQLSSDGFGLLMVKK